MVIKKIIYKIVLVGINVEKALDRYKIEIPSNIEFESKKIPKNTTTISELLADNPDEKIISFIDESKTSIDCTISMINLNNQKPLIDCCFNCFWCRNEIPNSLISIGCPIKYIPSQAVKTYYSDIGKDRYIIKEEISEKMIDNVENSKDKRLSVLRKGYYITDGAFCSFNCCMAYINENKKLAMYINSKSLLLKLYKHLTKEDIDVIIPAHHWRKLKEYGGNLTIETFRDNFNKVEYVNHGERIVLPKFVPRGILFEDKIKF